MEPKKKFLASHQKSSALVVSVILHVVFIVVAISFVAVSVIVKEEQVFEAREVKRPNMKLRKLQVPVKDQKKSQAPKLRKTIVAKPKTPTVDIKLPEIVGVKGGMGYGSGGGLGGLGFGFDMDLFGGGSGTGNEFVGTFYDLKQTDDQDPSAIGKTQDRAVRNSLMYDVIDNFVSSGFNPNRLKGFFKAPKLKYATVFSMPDMQADEAPKAFGVEDQVQPSYWLCHYKGQIAAPETGVYRFCGFGDDVLVVRVGRQVVLDACWPEHIGRMTGWKSSDRDNRKFLINSSSNGQSPDFASFHQRLLQADAYDPDIQWGNVLRSLQQDGKPGYMSASSRMVMGDWVTLKQGQRVDVDILIGEIPGGKFTCRLMIQKKDTDYPVVNSDAGLRPVLPLFKTAEINEKLVPDMKLEPNEMSLNGPVFGVLKNTTL